VLADTTAAGERPQPEMCAAVGAESGLRFARPLNMAIDTGARVGPYEIVSAIGAGGMGEVYRARDARLQRDVALKVLPAGASSDPDRLARFEQEARAAAALNHSNILAVYDVGSYESAHIRRTNLAHQTCTCSRFHPPEENGSCPLEAESSHTGGETGRSCFTCHPRRES
jgi:serine/threonine protein kinase